MEKIEKVRFAGTVVFALGGRMTLEPSLVKEELKGGSMVQENPVLTTMGGRWNPSTSSCSSAFRAEKPRLALDLRKQDPTGADKQPDSHWWKSYGRCR